MQVCPLSASSGHRPERSIDVIRIVQYDSTKHFIQYIKLMREWYEIKLDVQVHSFEDWSEVVVKLFYCPHIDSHVRNLGLLVYLYPGKCMQ